MHPLLTISCLTYNHEKFLRQTLDGFVSQKTNFKFEVIIHDDASTDATQDIIKEYQEKYPEIIKPILQTENQHSKKISISRTFVFPNVKTKYLAICEGDDYWTDENKLQKQVDFLEANPDYSICFHPVKVIYENNFRPEEIYPEEEIRNSEHDFEKLQRRNFIQTNSVVYRWRFPNGNAAEHIPTGILPGDWYWHLLHAQVGKIKMLPDVMSVYRKHAGGIWYDEDKYQIHTHLRHGLKEIKFYYSVYKNITNSSEKYFNEILIPAWRNLLAIYGENGKWQELKTIAELYPEEYSAAFSIPNDEYKLELDFLISKVKKYKKLTNLFIFIASVLLFILLSISIMYFIC